MITGGGELGRDSDGRAHVTDFLRVIGAGPAGRVGFVDDTEFGFVPPNLSRKLNESRFFSELLLVRVGTVGGISPMRPSCRDTPSQPWTLSDDAGLGGLGRSDNEGSEGALKVCDRL